LSALIIEGVHLASDAADLIADKHDMLCAFHYRCVDNAPQLQVSCRTRRTDLDLNALAKCFGGGGHRGAAGWTVAASGQDPYSAIGSMLASGAEKAWSR
jgi:nanoRNase/pAp phosphatase (c-di-AMP/oligoRNAs hydrolase)